MKHYLLGTLFLVVGLALLFWVRPVLWLKVKALFKKKAK